jgi:hypothetical protein
VHAQGSERHVILANSTKAGFALTAIPAGSLVLFPGRLMKGIAPEDEPLLSHEEMSLYYGTPFDTMSRDHETDADMEADHQRLLTVVARSPRDRREIAARSPREDRENVARSQAMVIALHRSHLHNPSNPEPPRSPAKVMEPWRRNTSRRSTSMLRSLMLCAVLGLATHIQAAVAGGPCYDWIACPQIGPNPTPGTAYYNKKCVPDLTTPQGIIGAPNSTTMLDPADYNGAPPPTSYPMNTLGKAIPGTSKCGITFLWQIVSLGGAKGWKVQKYYDSQTQQWLPLPCGYYYAVQSCANS